MKIAIPTSGKDLDAPIDPRFGRAAAFLIIDSTDESFVLKENSQNLNAAQGAGIQSAQNIASEGVDILISRHTGPKAFQVLSQAEIKIFQAIEGTVKDNLEAYKNGKLSPLDGADVNGHWV